MRKKNLILLYFHSQSSSSLCKNVNFYLILCFFFFCLKKFLQHTVLQVWWWWILSFFWLKNPQLFKIYFWEKVLSTFYTSAIFCWSPFLSSFGLISWFDDYLLFNVWNPLSFFAFYLWWIFALWLPWGCNIAVYIHIWMFIQANHLNFKCPTFILFSRDYCFWYHICGCL